METINLNLNKIANIFGYEYNNSFFKYLKSISKPNNQACNKRIKEKEGGWKCIDCEIDSLSIICNNCFNKSKEKHKGHNFFFSAESYGFCDCGDPTVIIQESFCPDHKGPFTDVKEILNYIKKSFEDKLLNSINFLMNDIFETLTKKIGTVLNMNPENEEYKNEEDELFEAIDKLETFISNLYESNLELFHFVALKFTENFPFETNHKCFYYNEENNLIITEEENPQEKHMCICPFFQIIINILLLRKTKHDSQNFFSLFIQNYKNKIVTSLSFLHSFLNLYSNENLKTFRGMSYQLINSELSEIVFKEKNVFFLENFYRKFYVKIKKLLDLKLYEQAFELVYKLYEIVNNFFTLKNIDKIRNNLKIYNILIDTICLINNINIFRIENNINDTAEKGFSSYLLNCEIYCLYIANLLSIILDYNNLNSVKFIFNKIISKLFDYKNYREALEEKEFTPHIAYIRCYTIFLNRFCFHYSINNNCDLFQSFNYIQNILPEITILNAFLFKELVIYFGFMISLKYSLFNFGQKMELYYINYFSRRIMINCDITLMKYLLTTSEINNEFNIDNILLYSNIDSSNDFFIKLKQSIFNEKNESLSLNIKNEENNLKYINSILDFILQIIKNNFSMINLAFKYSDLFRMKFNDILFDTLFKKEKINIENILKNEIIHYIFGNKNIIKKEDCVEFYNIYTSLNKKLDKDLVDKLLKEKCNIVFTSDKLKNYSLKKDVFNYCDIDYIIDYEERENAINYIIDLKEENLNISNTYMSESLDIQVKLNQRIYENVFSKGNLGNLIYFYNIILSDANYEKLIPFFFINISRIICTYIKIYKENINETFKNKLIEIINNNNYEGNIDNLIQYIKKLLSNENIKKEKKDKLLESNSTLKEEFNKTVDEEKQLTSNNYSLSDESKSNKNHELSNQINKICIFCKKPLNNCNINNYYGIICFMICDYFIDILNNKDQDLRIKKTRFVTCDHYIHFGCYSELEIQNINENFIKDGFECPQCKKLSNILLNDFSYLIRNNKNFFKGIFNFDIELNRTNNIHYYYINDDDIKNYQSFIIYNKNFFEIYCSNLLKTEITINAINADTSLFEKLYNLLLIDFDSFTIYYQVSNYKKEQINIWKNILFTIRFLCKGKILDYLEFFVSKFSLLFEKFKNLDFSEINNFDISSVINQFIFCFYIVNDLNEGAIKKIFQNNIMLYIFGYYSALNDKMTLAELLCDTENYELLKNIFNFYYSKYKICLLLYDEDIEFKNLKFEESIQFLKTKEFNNYALINSSTNKILKEAKLGKILKFNTTKLPESFSELLSKYMNINCICCKEKPLNYFICLICGIKICNDISNEIEDSKGCKCGNTLLISNTNSQIVYLLNNQLIDSKIFVYLNSLREYKTDYRSNDDYNLNRNMLQKSIQIFIDITFRKKVNKSIINKYL